LQKETNYKNVEVLKTFSLCGFEEIKQFKARIHSPGHPNSYKGRLNCTWLVGIGLTNPVKIYIEKMDIEKSLGCQFDHLILKFANRQVDQLQRFCGNDQSNKLQNPYSGSAPVYINFQSDSSVSGSGFSLIYEVQTPCSSNPCFNNGSCKDSKDLKSFTCDCESSFDGVFCEKGITTTENIIKTTQQTIFETTKNTIKFIEPGQIFTKLPTARVQQTITTKPCCTAELKDQITPVDSKMIIAVCSSALILLSTIVILLIRKKYIRRKLFRTIQSETDL